jgi:hypothetical protein
MQSEQSDTCFWQNGRMNPKFQFDRRTRRRAMPIVGCAFARYNLNLRFWQNEPNRFLLECPCLDVPTWQTQWRFAPAAALTAAHFCRIRKSWRAFCSLAIARSHLRQIGTRIVHCNPFCYAAHVATAKVVHTRSARNA